MHKRKSEKEWLELVKEYTTSGLNLTAWCKKNNICKSSIYPYLKKIKASASETSEQKWGVLALPKRLEVAPISLKIGTITLEIKNGFEKETLADILSVVIKL